MIDGEQTGNCTDCGGALDEYAFAYNRVDDDPYCDACLGKRRDKVKAEAEEYAFEHCKLTGAVERFDEEERHACTPEEYAAGAKESYTKNSVAAHNRHNRTNYDELLAALDRDTVEGSIYYSAISYRINALIEEAGGTAGATSENPYVIVITRR